MLFCAALSVFQAQISFVNGGLTATENFNTLATSGTTNTTVPSGWAFSESGTNANTTYAADAGSTSTGNTYSYGTGTTTERAFGEVASGSLESTLGVSFTNNTDSAIVQLNLDYYVELWRKGATGVRDSMVFEYSTTATSLTTGTWTSVTSLNPYTANLSASAGAVNGDLSANRVHITGQVTGISVNIGSTIWIRFRAVNISGNDDGLAIDDFSATAVKGAAVLIPASISFKAGEKSVSESAGTYSLYVRITGGNASPSSIDALVSAWSTASSPSDYSISNATITFPANSANNDSLPLVITLNDDAIAENAEYIIFTLGNGVNANASGTTQCILYLKDNDLVAPSGSSELTLSLLTSFSNGTAPANSAEIVAYDAFSKRLFIANSLGAKLDVVDFNNPSAPYLVRSVSVTPYGNINSVAAYNGIIAAAIENGTNPQDSGKIVFFDTAGTYISSVKAGMMPDMIAFNHTGTKVYTANEGEPNTSYTNDPDGSVTVVDISGGVAAVNQSNVSHITFTSYNGMEGVLRAMGIRIYGNSASASKDFEPEYITIDDGDSVAWVTLQENNAIAKLNLANNTIASLMPLGYKDYRTGSASLDASDVTSGVYIANWPVKGMYLPDAIGHYTVNGQVYLVTANEGDTRAYTALNEEVRVNAANLDPVKFPNASHLKSNSALGKLLVTNKLGDTDADGDIDTLYAVGTRSFSIWNGSTGAQVYDNGAEFEQITSTLPAYSNMFNASNGTSITKKNRSDDKGPEPEGIATATISGNQYAFTALERVGGVMVYNINDPNAPYYVTYHNNRPPDLGSEGIIYIDASESPNGKNILILANETSSTLTVYEVNSCLSAYNFNVSGNASFCTGGNTALYTTGNSAAPSIQWLKDNVPVPGANDTLITVAAAGTYAAVISGGGMGCTDTTVAVTVTENQYPSTAVTADGSLSFCTGEDVTLSAGNDPNYSYQWYNGASAISGATSFSYTAAAPGNYSVIITNNNCADTSSVYAVAVNAVPTASVTAGGALTFCDGGSVTLNAATDPNYSYQWHNSSGAISGATSATYTATASENYSVIVTNNFSCKDTSLSLTVTVNAAPDATVNAGGPLTFCSGGSVTLNAVPDVNYTYQWYNSSSLLTGETSGSLAATGSGNYYVSIVNNFNCAATSALVSVTVNATPTVTVNAAGPVSFCAEDSVLLQGNAVSGATYQWLQNNSAITSATSSSMYAGASGNFALIITSGAGCSDTSAAIGVTEFAAPAAPVISMMGQVLTSTPGVTYQWYVDGNAISGATAQSYTVPLSQTGNFQVEITDANGCSSMSAIFPVLTLGAGEVAGSLQPGFFPNPFTLSGTLSVPVDREGALLVEVYNSNGQLVEVLCSRNVAAGMHQFVFAPAMKEAQGIYFIRVVFDNKVSSLKAVQLQ